MNRKEIEDKVINCTVDFLNELWPNFEDDDPEYSVIDIELTDIPKITHNFDQDECNEFERVLEKEFWVYFKEDFFETDFSLVDIVDYIQQFLDK